MPTVSTSGPPRILILDRDLEFSSYLCSALEDRNYSVKTVEDPTILSDTIESFLPNVILIDVDLGTISGIDLLPPIRSAHPDAGIIMLSSTKTPEIVFHALFEGASDLIQKPVIVPEVDLRIRSILKKQAARGRMRDRRAVMGRERNLLRRYFSREVAEEILSGRLTSDLRGEIIDISMMFFSIKNAGKILKQMDPAAFGEFLNEALVDVMDLIHDCDGSVSKVNSAGMLATFGLPVPGRLDADRAVSCARRIREHFQTMNDAGVYEFGKLSIGIGITSGSVFAGSIGSFKRMEYTLIGDKVNVASRLESLSGIERGEILIDRETAERASVSDAKEIADNHVRGRTGEIKIFSL